ncbi:O-antigen polymerase [Acinetobacter variabilis]|uniref:O-antigen polymerase n=1 Tax=Acinetobacter variabilis TaxID=70346 RepID=UPI0028AB8B3F|nr:O-antigen polymerase [Acinetobacter variabilis]
MIKSFYFFSILIIFAIMPEKHSAFSYEYNFFLSIYYFILLFVFLSEQRVKDSNWMRFDVIFLLGYTIVHFQIPFLESIGIEPSNPDFVWLNKEVVNYSTWLSLLAITLWMFGFSLVSKKINSTDLLNFNVNYYFIDILLLIFFLGFLITVGTSFLSGAYDDNSWGAGASHFGLILRLLLYLRIIYFFKEFNKNESLRVLFKKLISNKIFFCILIFYTLLFFLTGARGEVLRIALVIAFGYSIFINKLPLKYILISITIGAIIFTLMGLGRDRDASNLSGSSVLERGYEQLKQKENGVNFTEELAYSVRILYRAIDVVPQSHPYLFGITYIPTLVSAIPFASGFYVRNFNIPDAYLDSAYFFTYIGQGNNTTYGEGSEILGDIYINFSALGVFLIMFLFGVFSAKVSNEAKNKKFNYLIIYLILLITALSMNRGTILYVYKEVIYMLILHYVLSGKVKFSK